MIRIPVFPFALTHAEERYPHGAICFYAYSFLQVTSPITRQPLPKVISTMPPLRPKVLLPIEACRVVQQGGEGHRTFFDEFRDNAGNVRVQVDKSFIDIP